MNFDIACPNCGAISSPAVGVCPFCKSVMTTAKPSENQHQAASVPLIQSLFDQGKNDQALVLASTLEKNDPDVVNDPNFVLLYVQIQIEVDAPSSKTRAMLNQALTVNPSNHDLLEYLELAEAEFNFKFLSGRDGEVALFNIVRRSPQNAHALFLLGRHFMWDNQDPQRAVKYLEACCRLRPNFVRAKACLGACYKALGMTDVADRLMYECASRASDPRTKEFFRNFAKT